MSIRAEVDTLLMPLYRMIRTAVLRAVLQAVDDTGAVQVVKVTGLSDDLFDNLEHMQPYGASSRPPVGSEGLLLKLGNASNRVVLMLCKRDKRPTGLVDGGYALYDLDGIKVYLKPGGGLLLGSPDATKGAARKDDAVKVTLTAANIATLAALITSAPTGGPCTATAPGTATLDITGTITSGSADVKVSGA